MVSLNPLLISLLALRSCFNEREDERLESFESDDVEIYLQQGDDQKPLVVEFPNRKFTIDGQNELNLIFRFNCPNEVRDNTILSQDLDACLRRMDNPPLSQTGLPEVLEMLEERTVYIDREENIDGIFNALQQATNIEIDAISAAETTDQAAAMAEYMQAHQEKRPPNFTETYRKIYGAGLLDYPPHLNPLHIPVAPTYRTESLFVFQSSFEPPLLRVITNSRGTPRVYYRYFESQQGSIHVEEPERIHQVYSLVTSFKAEIDQAAKILHQHHPEIQEENFRVEFYSRMAEELCALDYEDPWQDRGAAKFSESRLDFETYLEGKEIGVLKEGRIYDAPWRLGSQLFVDIDRQGFGPMQVILGLAREAANDGDTFSHYEGLLAAEDFSTQKRALKTVLEKPVYVYALCLDYVLTKLENTIFRDPVVRSPKTSHPYLQDERALREYSLLHTATMLVAYPENDTRAKALVLEGVGGIEITYIWADVFQLSPQYPTLRLIKQEQSPMPDHGGQSLVFYVVSGDFGRDKLE